MTIRVLHVINSGEVGGGGTHLLHLIPGLARSGFSSEVAVGRGGFASDELHAKGTPVHVLGPMGITAPLRISALCRSMRPDLLHLHGSRAGFLGTLAARALGVRPVVYTAHAFAFKRRLPAWLRWLVARADAVTCARADRVICLTHRDVEAAQARGVLRRSVDVIPNGVDPMQFATRQHRRTELGIDLAVPVVGMIGRLVPDKDPVGFVAAASHVVAVLPHARFLLVGDGPLRREVEDTVKKNHLTSHVILTGYRFDIPELLATMDVVVLTSRWEGMPLVVLEAMASARPVIAPALPGLEEVIVDGETGHLVLPGDSAALAKAVVALLEDPSTRRAMGVRARERILSKFTLERMVSNTIGVYEAAMTREPEGRKLSAV